MAFEMVEKEIKEIYQKANKSEKYREEMGIDKQGLRKYMRNCGKGLKKSRAAND